MVRLLFYEKLQTNNKKITNILTIQQEDKEWLKNGGGNDIIQVDETETISIAGGDLYEEKNVVNIM